MTRIVTNHEMERRKAMVLAKSHLTEFMSAHSLTAMEWVCVLAEMMQRMISLGLREEWDDN